MAQCIHSITLPGDLSERDVRRHIDQIRSDARQAHGFGYGGGFSMTDQTECKPHKGIRADQAHAWFAGAAKEWNVALATKAADSAGETVWIVAAWSDDQAPSEAPSQALAVFAPGQRIVRHRRPGVVLEASEFEINGYVVQMEGEDDPIMVPAHLMDPA